MVMIMNTNFNIGNRIHELRTSYGLSQEQLALRAEITTTYLGQIERNLKHPTVLVIEKICNSLHISLSDFFNETASTHHYDPLTEKILCQLSTCTEKEKNVYYNILKQIISLNNES